MSRHASHCLASPLPPQRLPPLADKLPGWLTSWLASWLAGADNFEALKPTHHHSAQLLWCGDVAAAIGAGPASARGSVAAASWASFHPPRGWPHHLAAAATQGRAQGGWSLWESGSCRCCCCCGGGSGCRGGGSLGCRRAGKHGLHSGCRKQRCAGLQGQACIGRDEYAVIQAWMARVSSVASRRGKQAAAGSRRRPATAQLTRALLCKAAAVPS